MFKSLSDVFDSIKDCDYVVLRNYEEFNDMNFLLSHPDIDLLCRNRKPIIHALDLTPRRKKDDNIHYSILIKDVKVAVDLRCVGDGYLDAAWEDAILDQKIMHDNYYIMDMENYFYTLLYHVTIQKNIITEDYKKRLIDMSRENKIDFSLNFKKQCLNSYMKSKGYIYTYPEYVGTTFNVKNVPDSLIEKNIKMKLKRRMYYCLKKIWKIIKRFN